jgi:ketosteroid isomerase-like protein
MNRLSFVPVLLLAACLTAHGQTSSADAKSLEEFDRAWGDAALRGDRAFLNSIIADDFVNLGLGGIQGKAESIDILVKQAEKNKAMPTPPKSSFDYYMVSSTPTTATITHRSTTTSMANGKEETSYARSIHFLEKRGGKWQVVSNAGHALSDAEVLMYMEHEWNDADIKKDAAWFERNYADDATDISSRTGAINGKAETVADVKTGKTTMEWAELSDLHPRVDGRFAVVTGVNHVKGRDDKGVPFERWASFTDTYIKRDGRWLVWATEGTEIKKEQGVTKPK